MTANVMFLMLYLSISVNSEANARRISMVENCFGIAGQVFIVGFILQDYFRIRDVIVVIAAVESAGSCTRRRRCTNKGLSQKTQAETVFPIQ